jgi:hypothetical protein
MILRRHAITSDGRNRRVRAIPHVSDGQPAATQRFTVVGETPTTPASSRAST